jgi:hypothetical protein
VARTPGKPVILIIPIAAENIAGIAEILRCVQNDRIAKKNCRTRRELELESDAAER